MFPGWRQRAGQHLLMPWPAAYAPIPVAFPRTWFLRVGWLRHGLIDIEALGMQRDCRIGDDANHRRGSEQAGQAAQL